MTRSEFEHLLRELYQARLANDVDTAKIAELASRGATRGQG